MGAPDRNRSAACSIHADTHHLRKVKNRDCTYDFARCGTYEQKVDPVTGSGTMMLVKITREPLPRALPFGGT